MPTDLNPAHVAIGPPALTLARWARVAPQDPCLFFQHERRGVLDWTWWSWRQLAHQVQLGLELLEKAPAERSESDPIHSATPTSVVFPYRPVPEYLAFDLAVQVAGFTPMPVWAADYRLPPSAVREWNDQGARVIDSVPGAPETPAWARSRDLPMPWLADLPETSEPSPSTQELLQRVSLLDERLPEPPASTRWLPPFRDIVVSCRSLADSQERDVVTWALWRGAALVLDADPDAWLDLVSAVRPTLLHGSLDELAGFRAELLRENHFQERSSWWSRITKGGDPRLAAPLDRLRAVIVMGREAEDKATSAREEAAWSRFAIPVV